jgi:multicomponent Na+:H+ antiporter subunit C
LLIFVAAGLTRGRPPLIGSVSDSLPVADPLPQALILTAIVISFGVFAFVLTLVRRAIEMSGSDDPDALTQERR